MKKEAIVLLLFLAIGIGVGVYFIVKKENKSHSSMVGSSSGKSPFTQCADNCWGMTENEVFKRVPLYDSCINKCVQTVGSSRTKTLDNCLSNSGGSFDQMYDCYAKYGSNYDRCATKCGPFDSSCRSACGKDNPDDW